MRKIGFTLGHSCMYIVFLCLIIEPVPQYDDCKSVVRQ